MNDTQAMVAALIDAAHEAEVRMHAYSGRGMFGARCLGVEVNNFGQAAEFFVALAQEDTDLAWRLSRSLRTDDLGRGMIVYFPSALGEEVLFTLGLLDEPEL